MNRSQSARLADMSALGLSGLCLVHCVIGTLAIGMASVGAIGGAAVHGGFHIAMLFLATLLAGWALTRGWRLHRDSRVLLLGVAGLGLMASGIALHGSVFWETLLTICGVALLALAHLANLQLGRRRHQSA